jgi:hypothetical protein
MSLHLLIDCLYAHQKRDVRPAPVHGCIDVLNTMNTLTIDARWDHQFEFAIIAAMECKDVDHAQHASDRPDAIALLATLDITPIDWTVTTARTIAAVSILDASHPLALSRDDP